jgi:hypothetical protein
MKLNCLSAQRLNTCNNQSPDPDAIGFLVSALEAASLSLLLFERLSLFEGLFSVGWESIKVRSEGAPSPGTVGLVELISGGGGWSKVTLMVTQN